MGGGAVVLAAEYAAMTTHGANFILPDVTRVGRHQHWVAGGFSNAATRTTKLYVLRVETGRVARETGKPEGSCGEQVECSTLFDVVNTGFVSVPGARLLGSCCVEVPAGPGSNALRHFDVCHADVQRKRLGFVLLTSHGLCLACLPLTLRVPAAPSRYSLAKHKAPRKEELEMMNAGGAATSGKHGSGEHGKCTPTPAPRRTKTHESVRALQMRIKVAEVDLVNLRSEFVAFTHEVASTMDEIASAVQKL